MGGRIKLPGLLARRLEDGGQAALTTVAAARGAVGDAVDLPTISARSQDLFIVVDGDRVLVEGPVEVASGSRGRRPARLVGDLPRTIGDLLAWADAGAVEKLSWAWVVFGSLSSVDGALLSGVLRRRAADQRRNTYRQPAAQWVFSSDGALGPSPARASPVWWSASACSG